MKCCSKEMPEGVPFVMVRYWCAECKTEHLVNAQEMTDFVVKLHAEANNGVVSRLPDLL
jgi:hypothetical protein